MQESVIVCMPVYDKVHPLAWEADLAVMAELARAFPRGYLGVQATARLTQPHAENTMIAQAQAARTIDGTPFDWMLWVEDDTLPPPDIFARLREHASAERPVVHAISFDRLPPYDPSIWEYVVEDDKPVGLRPIRQWAPDTLYQIAMSGTCGTLFHMSVWDRLARPLFRMMPSQEGHGGVSSCVGLGLRFQEAGIPMFAYTGCVVPHISDPVVVDAAVSHDYQATHDLGAGIGYFERLPSDG